MEAFEDLFTKLQLLQSEYDKLAASGMSQKDNLNRAQAEIPKSLK